MKASTPIVPSLGLNAVLRSFLSGAVTAALGAPVMAQESMEIELDPFEWASTPSSSHSFPVPSPLPLAPP